MMRRFGLRDDQWGRIKDLLPGREGSVGVTAADNRLFVDAVLYRYWNRDAMARSAGAVRLRCSSTLAGPAVGPKAVSGSGCSNISQQTPTTNMR